MLSDTPATPASPARSGAAVPGRDPVLEAARELRLRLDEATLAVHDRRGWRDPLARATALASWLVSATGTEEAGEVARRRHALYGYVLGELLAMAAAPDSGRLAALADVVDATRAG